MDEARVVHGRLNKIEIKDTCSKYTSMQTVQESIVRGVHASVVNGDAPHMGKHLGTHRPIVGLPHVPPRCRVVDTPGASYGAVCTSHRTRTVDQVYYLDRRLPPTSLPLRGSTINPVSTKNRDGPHLPTNKAACPGGGGILALHNGGHGSRTRADGRACTLVGTRGRPADVRDADGVGIHDTGREVQRRRGRQWVPCHRSVARPTHGLVGNVEACRS